MLDVGNNCTQRSYSSSLLSFNTQLPKDRCYATAFRTMAAENHCDFRSITIWQYKPIVEAKELELEWNEHKREDGSETRKNENGIDAFWLTI